MNQTLHLRQPSGSSGSSGDKKKNFVQFVSLVDKSKKSDEFRPCYGGKVIAGLSDFSDYGLNPEDFNNMQEGEIREVFITLKD